MKRLLLIIISILLSALTVSAEDYIRIIAPEGVWIRSAPDLRAFRIGVAHEGMIFILTGASEDWYSVKLFTGEERYISTCCARIIRAEEIGSIRAFALPLDVELLEEMYDRVLMARMRSRHEAEELLPESLDPFRNQTLQDLLEERYLHEIFQRYNIHPGLFQEFMTVSGFYME